MQQVRGQGEKPQSFAGPRVGRWGARGAVGLQQSEGVVGPAGVTRLPNPAARLDGFPEEIRTPTPACLLEAPAGCGPEADHAAALLSPAPSRPPKAPMNVHRVFMRTWPVSARCRRRAAGKAARRFQLSSWRRRRGGALPEDTSSLGWPGGSAGSTLRRQGHRGLELPGGGPQAPTNPASPLGGQR